MPLAPFSGGARTPAWVDKALRRADEAGLGAIILVIPVDRAGLTGAPERVVVSSIVESVRDQITEQVRAVRAGVPVALREPSS